MDASPKARSLHRMGKIAIATTILMLISLVAGAAPANAAAGDYTKFKFLSSKYNSLDSYQAKGIVRGSGQKLTIKAPYSWRAVGGFKKPKVVVQRKIGKKWITQKKVTVKFTSRYTVTAKIPAYTVPAGVVKQKVQYRFKSSKSAKKRIITADTTSPFKVTYENQAAYTGFAAAMYGGMAAYCPTATVRIDPTIDPNERVGQYSVFKGISIHPIVATYAPADQLGVALHECAHMKQFYNFGASDSGSVKEQRKAESIFVADPDPTGASPSYTLPFKAIEHAADCASHAINPAGYLGYGGYCSQPELEAGQRLMLGQKY